MNSYQLALIEYGGFRVNHCMGRTRGGAFRPAPATPQEDPVRRRPTRRDKRWPGGRRTIELTGRGRAALFQNPKRPRDPGR